MEHQKTFEISFKDPASHLTRRMPLHEAAAVAFTDAPPIRQPPSFRGQWSKPGRYWFEKTRRHIVYESGLERLTLTLLDFDPLVSGVAGQPFAFHMTEPRRRYTPDFFVQLSSGGSRVVEVKAARYLNEPKVREVTEWASRACASVGWDYVIAEEPEPAYLANVTWLAGFRRQPGDPLGLSEQTRRACRTPKTVAEVEREIGNSIFVRPLLFHMLWTHEITADLNHPLSNETTLSTAEVGDA
jgi:hypothetical protein